MGDFLAGMMLTADMLNAAQPIVRIKEVDESVTSNSVAQNDNDLLFPVEANKRYAFHMVCNFTGDAAADVKFGFTFPAGARLDFHYIGLDTAGALGTFASVNPASGATSTIGTVGGSTFRPMHLNGSLLVGANAGTLQFIWAQNAANAVSTLLRTGSNLVAFRRPA